MAARRRTSTAPTTADPAADHERELLRTMLRIRRFEEACAELYSGRDDLELVASKEEALEGADALVICTEWKAFWSPDFDLIKDALSEPKIFDGRNLYNPAYMEELGIEYYGIGRGLTIKKAS